MLVSSLDQTVFIYDFKLKKVLRRLYFPDKATCCDLRVRTGSDTLDLVVGFDSADLRIVDDVDLSAREEEPPSRLCQSGHSAGVACVLVLNETGTFVSGAGDRLVLVWAFSGCLLKKIASFRSEVIRFAPVVRLQSLLKSSDFLDKKDHKRFLETSFQKFENAAQRAEDVSLQLKRRRQSGSDSGEMGRKREFVEALGKCALIELGKQEQKAAVPQQRVSKTRRSDNSELEQRVKTLEEINRRLLQICSEMDS